MRDALRQDLRAIQASFKDELLKQKQKSSQLRSLGKRREMNKHKEEYKSAAESEQLAQGQNDRESMSIQQQQPLSPHFHSTQKVSSTFGNQLLNSTKGFQTAPGQSKAHECLPQKFVSATLKQVMRGDQYMIHHEDKQDPVEQIPTISWIQQSQRCIPSSLDTDRIALPSFADVSKRIKSEGNNQTFNPPISLFASQLADSYPTQISFNFSQVSQKSGNPVSQFGNNNTIQINSIPSGNTTTLINSMIPQSSNDILSKPDQGCLPPRLPKILEIALTNKNPSQSKDAVKQAGGVMLEGVTDQMQVLPKITEILGKLKNKAEDDDQNCAKAPMDTQQTVLAREALSTTHTFLFHSHTFNKSVNQ
ncbi:hypothetical protein FGO68_gene7859 [Halteria grandinella]|uniref:Uncharacterized protein n=1 Tax=Halteria grandinella TaxID=5974 RepID=A0A8J8T7H4_HALGN|nr:hypothetical protein FGO68_gene7859 [Halteria grandinella]